MEKNCVCAMNAEANCFSFDNKNVSLHEIKKTNQQKLKKTKRIKKKKKKQRYHWVSNSCNEMNNLEYKIHIRIVYVCDVQFDIFFFVVFRDRENNSFLLKAQSFKCRL